MKKIAAVDVFERDPKTKEICTGMLAGLLLLIMTGSSSLLRMRAKVKRKVYRKGRFYLPIMRMKKTSRKLSGDRANKAANR